MATFSANNIQSTLEKHTYTVDFTADIPTGGSITAGTAVHTPPSGAGTALTTTVASPYLYVTFPVQPLTGIHYVDVIATASDGDLPVVRIAIEAVYPSPTARIGMLDIIMELRALTEVGEGDYTIIGVPYWSDKQLQDILDRHAWKYDNELMTLIPSRKSGGYAYQDYYIGRGNIEQTTGGTSIFKVMDSTGAVVSSSLYSVDYNIGKVTFTADQVAAILYFVTCNAYDMNAAAADVWRKKTSHYASAYDFSSDNHSVKREQLYLHAKEQTSYFLGLSSEGAGSISLGRPDDLY